MAKLIEKLTDEQIARFPEFIEKWTRIGLSTEPADRPRAEAGIADAYRAAKLQPPRVVWCGSPLSQGLTRYICVEKKLIPQAASVWDSVGASVRDRVWDSVWDSVRASVRASVLASVGASVRDSVWDSVWASVRDRVRDSVWDSVWASVRDSVWDSVWDSVLDSVGDSVRASVLDSVGASVRDSVGASVLDSVGASVLDSVGASGYGQHDASWIGFYDYFKLACGLGEQTKKLRGLTEICQSANWFLPYKSLCWISDRHTTLNRNERGRLHCEDGPALAYQDGWRLWYLRGVAVDEQIVMHPQAQTIAEIRSEKNEEVKRLRIERWGWDRYLVAINAKQINTRRNDIEGTKEALYQADGHCVLVCACPSTSKLFSLECPPTIETCEQAQAYLSSGLSSRIISAA